MNSKPLIERRNTNRKLRQTELVYTTALGWTDERFNYWIDRAEQEFDWKLVRAPDLANRRKESEAIIVGGSGRHAFAAVRKGFRHVTYVDLTRGNTERAERLAQDRGIKNLTVVNADFLDWDPAGARGDLVVMNGVMQHISAPEVALRRATSLAHEDGVVYFDCYSAGSLYFLINEWLRSFYRMDEFDHVMDLVNQLGLDAIDLSFTSATMTERLSDDLFVPYIACYVEQDVIDSLVMSGFEILHRDHCPYINHSLPRYDSFQFLIRRRAGSAPDAIDFAEHSNFEMDYRDHHFVTPTIDLMHKTAGRMRADRTLRDTVLVGLMLRFHGWTRCKADGPTCHAELQAYLARLV